VRLATQLRNASLGVASPPPPGCLPSKADVERQRRPTPFSVPSNPSKGPLDDAPPPDPRLDTGYWKTRTERVLNLDLDIPGGDTVFRRWLTAAQMQRTASLDARDGLAYVLVVASGELSCQVKIWWEIPGSVFEYELVTSRTTLAFGTVAEIVAWSGPTPGLVCIEFIFSNGGPPVRAAIQMDICAKRLGANFMRRHWYRDATDRTLRTTPAPPFDPDPEGRRRRRRGRSRCLARGRPAQLTLPSSAVLPSALRSVPHSAATQRTSVIEPIEEPSIVPVCEPAASAIDWVVSEDAPGAWTEGEVTRVPDPEAVLAWQRFGDSFTTAPLTGGTAANTFPLREELFSGVTGDHGTPWYAWIARGDRFDALWAEVTWGLDANRMPQYHLQQVLLGDLWNAYATWSGATTADLDGMLPEPWSVSHTDWNWTVPALWLTNVQLWGMAQLWNVVHSTLDLLPSSVRSPRQGGATWVMDSARVVSRLTSQEEMNLRFAVTDFSTMNGSQGAFSVATGTWNAPSSWRNLATADFRGQTYSPDPLPSSITLDARTTIPFFEGAADAFALARLYAMLASRFESQLRARTWSPAGAGTTAYDSLVDLSRSWYRFHLACMSYPGKVLVHELFHTLRTPSAEEWDTLDSFQFHAETTHCGSGCAQEKMGSAWLLRMGTELGVGYPQLNGDLHPTGIATAGSISDSSTCISASDVLLSNEGSTVGLMWSIGDITNVATSVIWSYSVSPSPTLQQHLALIQQDWNAVAQSLQTTLSGIQSTENRLASLEVNNFGQFLLEGGWIAQGVLALEDLSVTALLNGANAYYRALLAAEQGEQDAVFRRECWDPSLGASSCIRVGSCK
jgi:hypothetical protein